ncbi:MAG: ATP-binding protein [Pseudomonadota bacterium]
MNLFWRVLGSFLLAMLATVAIVVFVSFRFVADRDAKVAAIDREEVTAQVEQALQTSGPDTFAAWLRKQEVLPLGQTVYLINEQGRDILDRPIPPEAKQLLRRMRRGARLRRIGRAALITDANETEFLMVIGPARPPAFGLLAMPGVHRNVLFLSLLVTSLICLLLTRYLTAPIRRMTQVANRLAEGDLNARAETLGKRRDEIGSLARQFDTMADSLQSAVDRRDQLLRHLSHEVRTPLTRIELALELADRQPERIDEQLARISKEAQNIEDLTEQALSLIRAGAAQKTEQVSFHLDELCDDIARDAQIEAQAKAVEIRVTHNTRPLKATADVGLIKTATENVVRNALRYAPAQSTVTIATRARSEQLIIDIRDEGPGVANDALAKLFEPFYSTDTNHQGLGLALTYQAMQAHGGSISASNHPEGGLQIRLQLPNKQP